MNIQFMFNKLETFCPLFPTHPTSKFMFLSLHPHFETLMLVQGGHPQQLWDHSRCHEGFLGVGKGVGDVGVLGHFGTLPF
jgi:hypothetical protein